LSRTADFADAFARCAPDPSRLDGLDGVALPADPDPELLAVALGWGSFLPRQAAVFPDLIERSTRALLADGPAAVLHAAAQTDPSLDAETDLRRRRNLAQARIALAQLSGLWSPDQVWQALSDVAETLIDDAVEIARQRLCLRWGDLLDESGASVGFTVLGFGKLGSGELNFSSDVDLVFVAARTTGETAGGPEGTLDGGSFLTRLAQGLIGLLDDHTDAGFAYRVDTRLRPDGTRGVLVPGADAFVDYYRSWSSNWERIALLRARPVGGDRALGERLLGALHDHIYPRHLDFESLEAMREIKDKIDREAARRQRRGFDIKLGSGGIRELEFLVQNLQIIFGGREPSLQVRGTLPALRELAALGIMPPSIRDALTDAYRFLRHVENVLQSRDDRQTQLLPVEDERAELARACGFAADPFPDAALSGRLDAVRRVVQEEFDNLYRRKDDGHAPTRTAVFELIEDEGISKEERGERLRALGFRNPDEAVAHLQRLIDGPRASTYGARSREQFERILPLLVESAVTSPDPDQVLNLLSEFVPRVGGRSYLYALLRENPDVIRAIAALFAGSLYLGRFFLRHPELLDTLVLRSHAVPVRDADALTDLVEQATRDHPAGSEERLDALRRLRMQETLRVGWHDLNGIISLTEVQAQLTDLAVALVADVRADAFAQIRERWSLGDDMINDLVPIALGKLGSGEFGYGSDLDLIFVVRPGSDLPIEAAIRWGQKMITLLQTKTRDGSLYEVDMRLRPSGNQGLLVTTFPAFHAYHERQAAIWERVALLKRRVLIGGAAGEALDAELAHILFAPPLTRAQFDEMLRIRDRMEQERGRQEPFKAGPGGMADLDLALAMTQLRHGRQVPRLRARNPWDVLVGFDELGGVWAETAPLLRRALWVVRTLESRVRLLMDRPVSRLPDDDERRSAIAHVLGMPDTGMLVSLVEELAAATRAARDRVLEAVAADLIE
jgi:glutamate-ammonia-ligase adenylyltransferase